MRTNRVNLLIIAALVLELMVSSSLWVGIFVQPWTVFHVNNPPTVVRMNALGVNSNLTNLTDAQRIFLGEIESSYISQRLVPGLVLGGVSLQTLVVIILATSLCVHRRYQIFIIQLIIMLSLIAVFAMLIGMTTYMITIQAINDSIVEKFDKNDGCYIMWSIVSCAALSQCLLQYILYKIYKMKTLLDRTNQQVTFGPYSQHLCDYINSGQSHLKKTGSASTDTLNDVDRENDAGFSPPQLWVRCWKWKRCSDI